MKKILIISYYDLKEYFLSIKNEFEKYLYAVDNYPLFRFAYDANDKKDNYKEHFDEYITKSKCDIILWWFIDVDGEVFTYIKNKHKNILFIMYNFDDPINFNTSLLEKCKIFNMIFTSCKSNINKYIQYTGNENVFVNYFGFDDAVFYPIVEHDAEDRQLYECDISVYCVNLFMEEHFPNQYIPLCNLINSISNFCKKNNYVFKLFGPLPIGVNFNEIYCGDVQYHDLNKLYNYSKINICTHPTKNGLWINDHVSKILGAGGLLFIDKLKDIDLLLQNYNTCIHINKDNFLEEINKILKNYDKFSKIRESACEFSKKFTWKEWVKNVHVKISKYLFDPETYKSNYEINIDDDKLFDYWVNNGLVKNQICYKYDVPNNFNSENYSSDNNLVNKSIKYLWLHWFLNSKETIYLEKQNKSSFSSDNLNVNPETMFKIMNVFNKIKDSDKKDASLIKLSNIIKQNPYIDINKALQSYIDLCEL